jgi:hypothetical protein
MLGMFVLRRSMLFPAASNLSRLNVLILTKTSRLFAAYFGNHVSLCGRLRLGIIAATIRLQGSIINITSFSSILKWLPSTLQELDISSEVYFLEMPLSPPLFPQNLTKLYLKNPIFLQPRIGTLPQGLISLKLSWWEDYEFDTLDLSSLPSTLRKLNVSSFLPFRLTGVLPAGLQTLYTSNHLIVDCLVPEGVAHDNRGIMEGLF